MSLGASGWAVDGDTYVSSAPVPLTPVDDSESEDDETLKVVLGAPPDLPGTVDFVAADGTACTDSCMAAVTILDDDNDHSGTQELRPPDVTIEAVYPTALQGIDDLVFTVTRSSASEEELEVPVTLSPGIVAADRLSHTVTIPANETSAELTVRTETLDPAATTGDVTATVGDGESHDVGDPSSVTVRVYVGTKLVTVRFNAVSYMLAEGGGGSSGRLVLLARTEPGVPAPTGTFQIAVTTQAGTASSPDDYGALSSMLSFPGLPPAAWIADGDAFWAEVLVPLTIVDDTEVTLVHVPDGTVIPDNSSLTVGETVQDGTTFTEGERVLFRLQFAAADGGPPVGGADVELTAWWSRESPLVPTSGHISRVEFSLRRVTQWDTAIQILDNDVGNPDGTATIRITGCKRNGCVIGEPSEITVTIADDDGGPETAPPGKPDAPRLVCASVGDGYDSTGIAVSWQAPTFEGGAAIDGYEVQYRRRIGAGNPWVWGEWQAWPHNGTATSTAITGLDVETPYGVQVRAFNANGPGQWSLPNTFRTGQSDQICEILDRFTP